MKQIILTALVIILFASCKKTSQCYNCTYGTVNGYTRPPDVQCNGDINSYKPQDAQGNDISWQCLPQ